MRLVAAVDPNLPRLGWLAIVDLPGATTEVLHGRSVETADRFVVEGVWAGDFREGAFARSPTFFGSGLELGSSGIVVSPSRALVDRVFTCKTRHGYIVSNSLALLLFATESTLVPGESYHAATHTILKGIRDYDAEIPVRSRGVGPFQQHYFHPFAVTEEGLPSISVPEGPQFEDYESYVSFLRSTIGAMAENSRDSRRTAPFTERLTLSRGYDSPAVAVLLSGFGSPTAYTAARSNSLVPSWIDREATLDDGAPIARKLGLPVRRLEPGPPLLDERLFLVGGTEDPELIFGTVASDIHSDAAPSLLFTGYHGDKVWARDPGERYLTPELRRGDTSGLALSEVRLHAGFINVAVPFLGARGIQTIVAISRSPEMRPWSLGGSYDRPIPRRIVEEAGIPREWFGHRKRAVLQTHPVPVTPDLIPDFGRWLEHEIGIPLRRYRLLIRAGLGRWALLRTLQKVSSGLGLPTTEPVRWPWIPGRDPASLLYRWAMSELVDPTGPFPTSVRDLVRNHLTRSSR